MAYIAAIHPAEYNTYTNEEYRGILKRTLLECLATQEDREFILAVIKVLNKEYPDTIWSTESINNLPILLYSLMEQSNFTLFNVYLSSLSQEQQLIQLEEINLLFAIKTGYTLFEYISEKILSEDYQKETLNDCLINLSPNNRFTALTKERTLHYYAYRNSPLLEFSLNLLSNEDIPKALVMLNSLKKSVLEQTLYDPILFDSLLKYLNPEQFIAFLNDNSNFLIDAVQYPTSFKNLLNFCNHQSLLDICYQNSELESSLFSAAAKNADSLALLFELYRISKDPSQKKLVINALTRNHETEIAPLCLIIKNEAAIRITMEHIPEIKYSFLTTFTTTVYHSYLFSVAILFFYIFSLNTR